ncbi:ABC transporter ATP-binding protein [Staphylococcus haemolyticus]|uniref:ABC transporter ATP-binding protein n=1 Tax=Staphylococcus haemolyticus TaxID=1283 RepID=UPI001F0B4200|nr:ABC transporter ATP-binding protein [Staphylococcus haemolyticus]MCH4535931.1 ABC transporter ATP-binding protein/permease [Staphylococcus haemolyticus]
MNLMEKKPLVFLVKKTKWPYKLILLAVFFSSISSLLGLIIPLVTGKFIDHFSVNGLDTKYIYFFIIIFLSNTFFGGLGLYLLSKIGESFIFHLRNNLSSHILNTNISFFDNNETGNVISRIIDDTNVINNFITQQLPNILPASISLFGSLIMLFILDWKTTLITLLVIALLFLIMLPLSKIINKVSTETQNKTADFSADFNRILNEIRIVKSAVTEKSEANKLTNSLKSLYVLGLKKAKITSIIQPISGLLVLLTVGIILIYGGIRVSNSEITVGTLIAMLFFVTRLTGPLADISTVMTDYQKANGASVRISEIFQEDIENKYNSNALVPKFDSDIHFKNVSFKYYEHSDNWILKNISFSIPYNKTTAIVGPSGSGKTTILSLLERFYTVSEGDILIGNKSIYEYELNKWRKGIGYVMQTNTLMTGTIKQNIFYGTDFNLSKESLHEYSKLANSFDFITNLKYGFDTFVGEKGAKLSSGQIQRINITRNFVKNPKLLLLDEATSNLDSQSENYIHHSLSKLSKNRTTLIIAHRLATIRNADNIIFLDNGVITGEGSHQELLQNHKKYYDFVNLQLND